MQGIPSSALHRKNTPRQLSLERSCPFDSGAWSRVGDHLGDHFVRWTFGDKVADATAALMGEAAPEAEVVPAEL
jgi:hypothetical protein